MRRECVRCHVIIHELAGAPVEHVCKDVAARFDRRVKQRNAVVALMAERGIVDVPLAERIVAVLANLGVDRD